MKNKFYRGMIALFLLLALLLPGCTSGTANRSSGTPALDANQPADTAIRYCPPTPGINPCVSWNS